MGGFPNSLTVEYEAMAFQLEQVCSAGTAKSAVLGVLVLMFDALIGISIEPESAREGTMGDTLGDGYDSSIVPPIFGPKQSLEAD
jgi:hypothetical protein